MMIGRSSLAVLVMLTMACAGSGGQKSPAEQPAKPVSAPPVPPADPPYLAEIQAFQRDREAALTSDTGWLTIAGLFFLSQPHVTFGSDPLNDMVLPAAAPPRTGAFDLRGGKVTVTAAPGVSFQLNGKTITSALLKSDAEGPPDRFSIGDLQLWVHMSGGRPSIRLRDKNSQLRKEFTGARWFPVNRNFRVEGSYEAYAKPKIVQVPNILGDIDSMPVPGAVSFALNGQQLKMEAVSEGNDNELWFIFRDLTSGKETYPAARFLYTTGPQNGKVLLDFNKAENPPCAYNPYTTCPLPPEQNRLRVRIEAGEKAYAGHGP